MQMFLYLGLAIYLLLYLPSLAEGGKASVRCPSVICLSASSFSANFNADDLLLHCHGPTV